MASVEELTYPKKSHRTIVNLPEDSANLAELFGIMMGDGGISNPWQATITLNAIKDQKYSRYIHRLVKMLFGITPRNFRYKTKDALRIVINSITIVDFLVLKGMPRGDKLKQGLTIPKWILSNKQYKIACVRGLIDTDGCIFVHKHLVSGKVYRNIGLTFSSRSPELIFQVAEIFEEFGIMPHITSRGTDIYLYQAASIARYLKIFGSSNSRIESVYKKWRGDRAV